MTHNWLAFNGKINTNCAYKLKTERVTSRHCQLFACLLFLLLCKTLSGIHSVSVMNQSTELPYKTILSLCLYKNSPKLLCIFDDHITNTVFVRGVYGRKLLCALNQWQPTCTHTQLSTSVTKCRLYSV